MPTPFRQSSVILQRGSILLAMLAATAFCADFTFDIPAVPVSLNIAGQPVEIGITGTIFGSEPKRGEAEQPFNLSLRANLADFQNHLTPLLQAELNQSNRCGERIAVENATLVPVAPAGRLTVQLHFEKWACFKALGKENAKKLLAGDGTVQVLLTPRLEESNAIRLDAEVGKIDADGPLGDLLRAGSLGAALRDKIRESLLKAIEKSADLEVVVPAQARPFVAIQSIAFGDGGSGSLVLNLAGRLSIPPAQVSSILDQFRNRR